MKTDKAREFWIQKGTPDIIADDVTEYGTTRLNLMSPITHVIEYTAVEQLEQKVKIINEDLTTALNMQEIELNRCKKLETENASLNLKLAAQDRIIAKLKEQRNGEVPKSYATLDAKDEIIAALDEELEQLTKESK